MENRQASKKTAISFRLDATQLALIDRAAKAAGRNRTEFVLEAASREAETVLLDRKVFMLDDAAWAEFEAMLNAPPHANERLKRLMSTRAPWDE